MYISNNRQVTHTTTNKKATSKKKKSSKKEAKKESTSPKKHKSAGQVLGDPRMLKVYGIILLAFSLLLLVSIVSHFFTFEADRRRSQELGREHRSVSGSLLC